MSGFFADLLRIPDKIEEVMEAIMPHVVAPVVERAKAEGIPAVWVGGWRSASKLISPAIWNRFAWPYLERAVHEVVDSGLVALLHLDSNWTRDLAAFTALPKGKCILSTDGETDLFAAKEILGGHMCLMGDVPARMLALATPDEVYEYSARLIRELGPDGFILHSGCDIPTNAQLANVKAMIAAGQ